MKYGESNSLVGVLVVKYGGSVGVVKYGGGVCVEVLWEC